MTRIDHTEKIQSKISQGKSHGGKPVQTSHELSSLYHNGYLPDSENGSHSWPVRSSVYLEPTHQGLCACPLLLKGLGIQPPRRRAGPRHQTCCVYKMYEFTGDRSNCPEIGQAQTNFPRRFSGQLPQAPVATSAHPTDIILRATIQSIFGNICVL